MSSQIVRKKSCAIFKNSWEEEFRHVSDGISELENLNEEIDIAENKNHHKQQLQMYKERKNQELEQAKGSKFKEHREVSLQKGLKSDLFVGNCLETGQKWMSCCI